MDEPRANVDRLLSDYLREQDEGRQPDPDAYRQRLDSAADRLEFAERVRCLQWTRSVLPAAVEAHAVIAGRYELLEEIGAGGFGKVWRARDRQLDREVAVKVLNVLASAHSDLDRYHRGEWRALSRLRHPGIVQVHAAAEHDGVPYVVMDLVAGRSLESLLRELAALDGPVELEDLHRLLGPCPPGTRDLIEGDWQQSLVRILVEVLRTLEAAHDAGVLHRDIKPANILVTAGGHPVLLDFGMAALVDEATGRLTGRLVGTAHYLAPEQIRSHAIGRSVLTDVYQVGLTMYEMLVLRPAFRPSEGISTIPDRILHGEFAKPLELRPELSPELEAICLRALQHVPERRFASATAFREALEHWLQSGAAPPGVAPEPAAADPEPGDEARFEVGEELLRNASEVVQLAWDRLLERTVVLKRAGPGLWSPHVRQRVKREARRVSQVEHPRIPALHEVHEVGDELVLVMEPVPGRPLAERLAAGALPVAEAVTVGLQAADALHALHRAGIVHCCVGPETVWWSPDKGVAVTGFCFARDLQSSTVSTIGFDRLRPEAPSPAYVAPEQQAAMRTDARTDVFALCCLLYLCLTGRDPAFDGGAPDPRALCREVPRALSRALVAGMQAAPSRRHATMLELAEALQRCR